MVLARRYPLDEKQEGQICSALPGDTRKELEPLEDNYQEDDDRNQGDEQDQANHHQGDKDDCANNQSDDAQHQSKHSPDDTENQAQDAPNNPQDEFNDTHGKLLSSTENFTICNPHRLRRQAPNRISI